MDFYEVLTREKQNEFWKDFEELVSGPYQDDFEAATFVAYENFKKKYKHNLTYTEHWSFLGEEVESPTECPACKDTQVDVIYMGASMQLCTNKDCRNCTGFFSWVPLIYFNGWFFPYTGGYFRGLWDWLFGKHDYEMPE